MAHIIRACSYKALILTPQNPSAYSEILVTVAQDQEIKITKRATDLEFGDEGVVVTLTQEDTLQLRPSKTSVMGRRCGAPAYMQIRAYAAPGDAPGSANWELDVIDSQSEEVLGNG